MFRWNVSRSGSLTRPDARYCLDRFSTVLLYPLSYLLTDSSATVVPTLTRITDCLRASVMACVALQLYSRFPHALHEPNKNGRAECSGELDELLIRASAVSRTVPS